MRLTGRLPALPSMLAGLLAVLLGIALAVGPAAPAHADVDAQKVAESLRNDPVYVAEGIPEKYPSDLEQSVLTELEQVDTPVFIAVLPASDVSNLESLAEQQLPKALEKNGTYLVVAAAPSLGNSNYWAASNVMSSQRVEQAADQAWGTEPNSLAGFLTAFPQEVQTAVDGGSGTGGDAGTAPSGGGGGFPVAGVFLLVLLLGGTLFYGVNRYKRHQRQAAELQRVRHVADEDVTRLGEDIAMLDLDVGDDETADATRLDYKRALDSYDSAKRHLKAAKRPEHLRLVSKALEDGRFQMACVRARLAGEPLPERRAPCFFNPQHGPSATDVDWAPPGGTTRSIPVCRADAERLRHGEEPETREVLVRGKRRPYWEAGPGYAPWFGGYYGGFYGAGGMMSGLLVGTMLGSAIDQEHMAHSAGFGGGFGGEGAGGFGGGFDGGGGGFGGGFGGGGGGGFGGGFGGGGGGGG